MPDEVILDVTTIEENVTVETTAGDVVEIQVVAPTGTAATIAVGTTTTGAAGTNASVTNSGTTSAAVFNFTIPRGDTGATGATGATGPNSVTSATTSDGTANLSVAYLGIVPSGSIALASTNSGGFVQLSGQAATDARSIAFPNASGTVALTASTTGVPDKLTDGTIAGTTTFNSTSYTYNSGAAAAHRTAMGLGTGDSPTFGGATFSGFLDVGDFTANGTTGEVIFGSGSQILFDSTSYTYGTGAAAAHRTALGVSASDDTVLKSAYTPAHSLLVQQSGTGSPSSLSVGNNTILGRASGGGSNIAALSGSDARAVLGLTTLATTTPAANVATFLATPTSANLAAAVTGETGSGALVFGTSPTITTPTISGTATVSGSFGVGTVSPQTKFDVNAGTALYLNSFNIYGSSTTGAGSVFGKISNTNTAGRTLLSFSETPFDALTPTAITRHGSTHSSKPNLLEVFSTGAIELIAGSATSIFCSTSGMTGIGTTSPNAKAILDVTSTTKGFLPPRMTTTQRDAITSVPAGLMVYNTTLNKLNVYNGTTWETVTSL